MATLPPMFSLGAVAAVLVILFLAGANRVDACANRVDACANRVDACGGFDVHRD